MLDDVLCALVCPATTLLSFLGAGLSDGTLSVVLKALNSVSGLAGEPDAGPLLASLGDTAVRGGDVAT